ncbi:MAG: TlpA disulfide reductase family protein [Spirochaetia bacterium]
MKLIIFLCFFLVFSPSVISQNSIDTGSQAPRFFGSTTEDSFFYAPSVFGSQPIVLSFFATYCEPCVYEMPALYSLITENYSEAYLLYIGTDPGGSVQEVADFAREAGITENVLFDTGNRIMNMYGIQSFPSTVIINTDGTIAHIHSGYSQEGMREIEAVLEEVCR